MAIQKQVNLNEPLDAEAKPTLSKSFLSPELSEASLILHGDYYRQLQSKLNKFIFWHPISISFMLISVFGFLAYNLFDYIVVADSFGEFFGFFTKSRDFRYQLTSIFPAIIVVFGMIGLSAYIISDEFRTISDKLSKQEYIEDIFGFDLRKFAKLSETKLSNEGRKLSPKDVKFLKNGDNTHLIIYRDSPIAIITLKPLMEKSSESNFFIKITGLHVRKVFAKVDFESLLLEWSILRSREIFQDFVENKVYIEGCKINILIDAYSFDRNLIQTLHSKSFGLVNETYGLNPFKHLSGESAVSSFTNLTHKVFGIKRQTFGATLVTKNGDNDLILKATRDSPFLQKESKQDSSTRRLRKRK